MADAARRDGPSMAGARKLPTHPNPLRCEQVCVTRDARRSRARLQPEGQPVPEVSSSIPEMLVTIGVLPSGSGVVVPFSRHIPASGFHSAVGV